MLPGSTVVWAMRWYGLRRIGAQVSPEVGIEKSSDYSHFPCVIRASRLEWAARHRDGQGATHSTVRSITTGDCRHKPGPPCGRSGRVLLSLDRVC